MVEVVGPTAPAFLGTGPVAAAAGRQGRLGRA